MIAAREKLSHLRLSKISLAVPHCFGGIQKADELFEFLPLVEELQPKRILEIGRWTGGMLWGLAQVAPDDCVLVSVDNGEYDLRHQAIKQEAVGHGDQRVEYIDGDSHTHDTMYKIIDAVGGERYDLLFIDGDHSYEGVKEDWLMYSPLVRLGGMIALHDIVDHPVVAECEVVELWRQLKAGPCPTREIIASDYPQNKACGIGVIDVTPDIVLLRAREAFK